MVTPRDRRIIELEERYGLLTIPTLQHAEFRKCRPNAAVKVINRLCGMEMFRAHTLFGRRQYYRNGPALGPQNLPVAFAVLQYCVLSDNPKLTKEEMIRGYPFLPTEGQVYCGVGDGICQLRVSLGGASDALVRKLGGHHEGLYHVDGYRGLISAGKYSIKVLVPTDSKARQIDYYLDLSPPPYDVETVVIPDLFQLLCGVPTHASSRLPSGKGQSLAAGQVPRTADAD